MPMAKESVVEMYRMGRANGELAVAWSDSAGERAIFCALQLYVDQVERHAISGGADVTVYEMEHWEQSVYSSGVTPAKLEAKLRELKDMVERGDVPTPDESSYALAEEVASALFSPHPKASYVIPRVLWHADDDGRDQRRRDAVETAANPLPALAPIASWLRHAFGEMVSQAEASRRLGLTDEGVRARIREGKLRSVRVGGNVLIPTLDLPN